jgi:hypothetical protein
MGGDPDKRLEGDGWVNWSGLATLLNTLGSGLAASLSRLLGQASDKQQEVLTRE